MNGTATSDIEMPKGKWQQVCESYTRQHRGWPE
jgi:hypothetical protein